MMNYHYYQGGVTGKVGERTGGPFNAYKPIDTGYSSNPPSVGANQNPANSNFRKIYNPNASEPIEYSAKEYQVKSAVPSSKT